jgi:SAM-dependent methyltransferase
MADKPDYGIDGYPFLIGLLVAVGVLDLSATLVWRVAPWWVAALLLFLSLCALVPVVLGLRYVRVGKFALRDRLLSQVRWRGDEHVLDLGTGGGLLLLGAARRAPRGRAVGLDIWRAGDLSGNGKERLLRNAALEGESVELLEQDVRKLPFADATFDVVLSALCIHNIPDEPGRDAAVREAARVLKPGGTILFSDLANTGRYAGLLREAGLEVEEWPAQRDTFPFQTVVVGRRRAAGVPARDARAVQGPG